MIRTPDSNAPGLILVVDDDRDTLSLITSTLRRAGYEVLEARNGPEALHQFDSQAPEVVLLDLMMPEMDGYEVLAGLKRRSIWPPPVIIFTAKAALQDKVRGLEAGAFKYLTKPAKREELLATVQAAVEEKRQRMQRPSDERW
ncbi:MAG: response regulator [Chloroflexi bacterium]|nr:response regulator [Chloroflexota bacterium]